MYGNDQGWGFVVREYLVRPLSPQKLYLIPYFALYSKDSYNPQDPPLLTQLIDRHHADPQEFLLEKIIIPLVATWCFATCNRGILFGSHGQNVLLELNTGLFPTRVVQKDLELRVDMRIRKEKELPGFFSWETIGGNEDVHNSLYIYSLIYDSYMGHHLFDYLLRCVKEYFSIDEEEVRARVREVFRASFPDAGNYFPDSTYYFSDELLPNNQYRLVDTGKKPLWR